MKKQLLFMFLLASSFGYSQITVFEDNFDSYNDFIIADIGQWGVLDIDFLNTYTGGTEGDPAWDNAGAPQAFQIFNPTTALVTNATSGSELRNFDPHSGAKFAACWAGVPAAPVTANNDWLISPPINLSGATGASLSVWVKSMSSSYGLEKYRIGVYVGSGTPIQASDFTIISGGADLTAPFPNWAERTQSLSAYDGQTIRVAIQCKSSDAYMFMVDDFKVTVATLGVDEFLTSKFSVYPNPVKNSVYVSNKENINVSGITITDLNGRVVKTVKTNNISDVEVNISELATGMYVMNINSDQGIATKKIVKE